VYLACLTLSALVPIGELGAFVALPPAWLLPVLAVSNLAGASILVLATLSHFVHRLRQEQERADALLLNILPPEIAAVLKERPSTIARHHDGVTILFADIVDFTPLCERLSPAEIVDMLNAVFSHFDELADRYGMEKIKTIGDAYMIVAGVPASDPRHAHKAAALALDMRSAVASRRFAGQRIDLRVGIHSGPVMAGVIGRRKFIYDVWGQAVNLASRMESQGDPGCIQITRATWELVRDEYACRPAGSRTLKGCGAVEVWTLLDRHSDQVEG
jgi:guanylate cyclase